MPQSKAIFITGGGSGIGRAMAQYFGARGWIVGIGDIDEAGMDETEALLPRGHCYTKRLDVRDRSNWDIALAGFAQAANGRIDVVVNNAGVGFGGDLVELSQEQVDRLIAINFCGVVNGARAAYPYLRQSAPGSCLLNTASASALYGTAGQALYSATKFAVRGLTEALDLEWEPHGIRVCSIMPGFIDTPLLAGPADSFTNQSKRDRVIAAGLEFTPIEIVAEAAWDAVHGKRLHTLVGKTALHLNIAARWAPGYLRNRLRKLLQARLGISAP